jgi:hypothetical protein
MSVDAAAMIELFAYFTCMPFTVNRCRSPLYDEGKKWSIVPESIAPVVGNFSVNLLHTWSAAGRIVGPTMRSGEKLTCDLLQFEFGQHGTSGLLLLGIINLLLSYSSCLFAPHNLRRACKSTVDPSLFYTTTLY